MRQVDPLVGGGGHAEGVPFFQVGKDLRVQTEDLKLFYSCNFIIFTVVILSFLQL